MRNITNVYEAVDSNKFKSWLVLFLFTAFFAGVLWAFYNILGFGLWTLGFALIFVGGISFSSYWWSDKMILTLSGAKPASRKEHFHFYTVTENLSLAAGLPKPKLYVMHESSPNAFATGRDPQHAVVCATTGLLEKLNRTELEGVIAHELSHVGNYDTRLMGIVAILAGIIVILSDFAFRGMLFGDRSRERGHPAIMAIAIVLIVLSPIIAYLIKLAISRRREFLADATGAKLTRFPEGLARALEKIAADTHPVRHASNATAHLYFENPFKADKGSKTNWLARLFNTHPPVGERIKALRAMV